MKIVILSQWFSENMGYADNLLPKALAKQNAEVYLVTSTAQIYYNSPDYKHVYESYLGPNIVAPGKKQIDGYTLWRLPYYKSRGIRGTGPGIRGLMDCLKEIQPDIIQVFEIGHIETYTAAVYCQMNPACKLFTECHVHVSTMGRKEGKKSEKEKFQGFINAINPRMRLIKKISKLTYAIAPDVKDILQSYYHVPESRIKIQSLGTDCDLFKPVETPEDRQDRESIRREIGLDENNVLCIYTGRFTRDKNPHCLAKAIDILHEQGHTEYKAIFLGKGSDEDIQYIQSIQGCRILPFVPVQVLPQYYRAADIGVWPREESTSQLDAVACGLPVILSDRISVLDRVTGNGLTYSENDPADLADKIRSLDPDSRTRMARIGVQKAKELFSWDALAKERMQDYHQY